MNWKVGMTGILRPLNELEIDFEGAKMRRYAKFSAPGISEQVIVHARHLSLFDGNTRVRVTAHRVFRLEVELPNGDVMQAFPHFLMEQTFTKPVEGIRKIRI